MHEPGYYGSARGRRDHSLNRNGGESGSAWDVNGTDSGSWSANIRKSWDSHRFRASLGKGDILLDNLRPSQEEDPDSANWIHRDKLARIESEELQQAAILFHRRTRGEGKPAGGRGRSHESETNSINGSLVISSPTSEQMEPWPNLTDEQREYGGPTDTDNGGVPAQEDRKNLDSRKPEESQQDDGATGMYRNPGLRKSSSRIPIATPSRLPVSSGRLGRDSPSQRSRALTNGSDTGVPFAKRRRASEPLSLEDTTGNSSSSAPSTGSRPGSRGIQAQNPVSKKPATKSNTNNHTTHNSTNRKVSAPVGHRRPGPKSRIMSNNSVSHSRPTTRSGEPRVINRPEGDPPWLATMYKPDPRLPPDQQILPTHAKRMQQEKWEKEGRTPITYDREFAPLEITPDESQPVKKVPEKEQKDESDKEQEPEPEKPEPKDKQPQQQSPPPPAPDQSSSDGTTKTFKTSDSSLNSGPPVATGNGYRTMPRLESTPPVGLAPGPSMNAGVTTTIRADPPKEDEENKKEGGGCGCCIVM